MLHLLRRRSRRNLLLLAVLALAIFTFYFAFGSFMHYGQSVAVSPTIEHPYFALPKRTGSASAVPDWKMVYEGATECFSKCSSDLKLFIMVCSAAGNREKRAAIRDTWAKAHRSTKQNSSFAFVRFFVGRVDNEQITRELREEAANFGDLILLRDASDDYMELIKKVLRGFQFLLSCFELGDVSSTTTSDGADCRPSSQLDNLVVVKTDDDNYVNVPKLFSFFKQSDRSTPATIYGCLQKHVSVRRSPTDKWHVPIETYPHEYYPDYVTGPLYAAHFSVIRTLVELATHYQQSTPILMWEDIFFTGILPQLVTPPIRREPLDGAHWLRVEPVDPCAYKKNVVNAHYMAPEELRKLWRAAADCK